MGDEVGRPRPRRHGAITRLVSKLRTQPGSTPSTARPVLTYLRIGSVSYMVYVQDIQFCTCRIVPCFTLRQAGHVAAVSREWLERTGWGVANHLL